MTAAGNSLDWLVTKFAREVPGPLLANMTEFGRGPLLTLEELGDLGYRAALYPLTAFRAAMRAAEVVLRAAAIETITRARSSGRPLGQR